MAKFKKNDLVTNGKEILWITEVDDTNYTICYNDGSEMMFNIDSIDKEYEVWKPKRIWHESSEEPRNNKRVVIVKKSYDGIHSDVGRYSKDERIIICEIDRWKLKDITHWANFEDLIKATL